jgi:carbon storage regulator
MLVLTRREGEGILIGEGTEVTVLEVKGSSVRIGIDAPPEIRIYRKELYLDIVMANKGAVLVDRQHLKQILSGIKKPDSVESVEENGSKNGECKENGILENGISN